MMPNFEKMFYMSQATIAKTIDTLEKTNAKLKECMRYCEHGVAEVRRRCRRYRKQ